MTLTRAGTPSATLAGVGRTLGAARAMHYEIAGDATLGDGTPLPVRPARRDAGARP